MRPRCAVIAAVALSVFAGCRTASAPATEAQAPEMLVTAARAVVQPMRQILHALGVTVATRRVTVRSPATGRITGIHLRNGDFVRKGEVIGYVINREIEAAEAGLEVARRIDPKGAEALEKSINRHRSSKGIPIVAPDAGVVFRPPVTSGQMVADLDPIAELVDPSSIYVEASIPVDELHLISPGMAATVTSAIRPGIPFPAKVAAIIPSFDASSATAPVRLDFTGSESIREIGAPVEARIVTMSVPDAVVIPAGALFQDMGPGRYHVFVVGPDGIAHRTDVTIGIHEGDQVQVRSGLRAGDEVITSGGYAISDGLKVRVAAAPS